MDSSVNDVTSASPEFVKERQDNNRKWWTDNTMSYDWKEKASQQKFSAEWFEEIDRRFLHGARLFTAEANPFVSLMGLDQLSGKRVLEIGCGMGMHSDMLVRAGAKLTSIDISPTSVEATSRRFALNGIKADIREMDAEKLQFADEEFDLVWSWGVIHHSAHTGRVVREIHRVLKPGGTAKIMVYALDGMSAYVTMMRRYVFGFWRGRMLDELLWFDSDGFTARHYTIDSWVDLLSVMFEDIEPRLCGQDADAIPLPRQIRRPLLKLFSQERLRQLANRRGSMLFSTCKKPL